MKKLLCVFCAVVIVLSLVSLSTVFSADTDFVIEDSVLLSYDGSDSSVTIPSSVRVIADSAFSGNTNIKSVKFHSDVYSIGNKAFFGCTSLSSVSGAESVRYVGALCFNDTPFLAQSTDEFLIVGGALVSYNGTSASVTLPDDVVSISPYAFLKNNTITEFSAGSALSSILEGAFYECSKLSVVNVTKSVSYVGADAFYGTKWQSSQGDFAMLGNGILVKYNGADSDVSLGADVFQIAPNAFYKNSNLRSVDITSSVFSVSDRAFMGCQNLSEVNFSLGLVNIGKEAFADCVSLKTVTTPMSLSRIGEGAFINCTNLNVCYLQGNDLTIERGAFAYCSNLESVLLSSSVSAVLDEAFSNAKKLYSVTVPDSVTMISPNAFLSGCDPVVICVENSFAHSALSNDFTVSTCRGDSDADFMLNIMDATAIQLHSASLKELPVKNYAFMDADFDASVSVMDATYVQLYIAQLL